MDTSTDPGIQDRVQALEARVRRLEKLTSWMLIPCAVLGLIGFYLGFQLMLLAGIWALHLVTG
ncbi:hypothetical protein ACFYOD_38855 [Streptomyces sp. NPDC006703]|uniref:hypothetical protein n=1 Tax=Streptomyces sp. NPDC006703 TaxID=3364759 RepID=UPI0036B4C1BF